MKAPLLSTLHLYAVSSMSLYSPPFSRSFFCNLPELFDLYWRNPDLDVFSFALVELSRKSERREKSIMTWRRQPIDAACRCLKFWNRSSVALISTAFHYNTATLQQWLNHYYSINNCAVLTTGFTMLSILWQTQRFPLSTTAVCTATAQQCQFASNHPMVVIIIISETCANWRKILFLAWFLR